MIKRIFALILSVLLLSSAMLCALPLGASATGSHGLYMDVPTDATGGKTKAFMIDFYSDSPEATNTYWSNTGFAMEYMTTARELGYRDMQGGGGYAGLQIRGRVDDRVGIMSFWEYRYRDKREEKILNADRVYPAGTSTFGGEGEGTNCIYAYPWRSGSWYRELLFSWQDEETGHTMAGTWFYDYDEDVWTLFCYFDTNLIKSYFKGTHFGQFLENYSDISNKRYRSFRYKNTYIQSYETEEWFSSPNVTLSSDDNHDAIGIFDMGLAEDGSYAYGWVDGTQPNNNFSKRVVNVTIDQPEKPTYGTPSFTLRAIETPLSTRFEWENDAGSTPQLSYKAVVTDPAGNVLAEKSESRPEIKNFSLSGIGDNFRCDLTLTDVFGQQVTKTFYSSNYGAEPATETPVTETPVTETPATETPVTETPATETPATETPVTETPATETPATETPATETPTTGKPDEKGLSTGAKVAIAVGAAAVVCAVAVGLWLILKKKKA